MGLIDTLNAVLIEEAAAKMRAHHVKPRSDGTYTASFPVKRVHPRDRKRDSLRTAVKRAWIGFLTASGPGAYLLTVRLTRRPCGINSNVR